MNFTQMHERLRLELLRRIQRGRSASRCWRARPASGNRICRISCIAAQLSLEALDRILAAQHMRRRSSAGKLPKEALRPTGKAARSRSSLMRRRCLSRTSGPRPCSRCCICPPGCCSPSGPGHRIPPRWHDLWPCAFRGRRAGHGAADPAGAITLIDGIQLADTLPANRPICTRFGTGASDLALRGLCGQPAGAAAAQHRFSRGFAEVDSGEPPASCWPAASR